MLEFLSSHWLDAFTTLLGLLYIWLEYRAHIALWVVSVVMPALDIWLYWSHGLYGDAGMAMYYTLAAIYGFAVWKFGLRSGGKERKAVEISRFPLRKILPSALIFAAVWAVTYWVLVTYTNSSVPLADSFTNALSIIALWALSRKYAEQWLLWIVVDAVCCTLYVIKGIPFKAGLYGLYIVIAIAGYRRWLRLISQRKIAID